MPSNEELAKLIQQGVDIRKNQELLYLQNEKFIEWVIKRYTGLQYKENEDNGFEDLKQQGFLGLITAAMKYNPDKGANFITYSAYWIKQSIFRYSENCIGSVRVPAFMKRNIRKYARYRQMYRSQNNRYPSEDELCKELKISKQSLKLLEKTIYKMEAVRLDEPYEDNSEMAFIDYIQSDDNIEEAVTYSVYCKELRAELESALTLLDNSTKQMIYSVYFQRNTMEDTAKLFGCTRQYVQTSIGKGFYCIIHSRHRAKLEEFMWNGYRYNERAYCNYANLDEAADNEFLL